METAIKLNPNFSGLDNPIMIQSHISELRRPKTATPHEEILGQLLEQIEPVDFAALAFPEAIRLRELLNEEKDSDRMAFIQSQLDKLKVTLKHFLILSIENVLKLAEKNNWGLCKNHDFIYLYNNAFWSEIDKEQFQKFLGEAAEKMNVPRFEARYYQFRDQLFRQFLTMAYLPTANSDVNKVQINLLNGTFEINQNGIRKLKPFDRNDFLTYQLPFEYDPKAKAPIFEKYLNRVLPDIDSQKVLAEFLGYVFIKNGNNTLKEEKALILYGSGANGKSVFFEVVNALLGSENVSSFSLQSLTNDNGYFRAKLANKLVNYASEINGNLETSFFKQLVSGEPIEARLPYGQPFNLTQYAKLIFNCNSLPKDVEHSDAYFRRFLIIPFSVTIPEAEQDKNLHTKIIENELAGVFNWVLEGLDRLLKQKGFSRCEAVRKAVEQYRIESNSVQMFLSENAYESNPENYTLIKDIYSEYKIYCIEDGLRPFNKKNFVKQLKELGFVVDRVSQNQLAAYLSKPIFDYFE